MNYSSWEIEQNTLSLVILGHFLPFYPLKNPKNQNFEKWKKLLEISSFYTIIWCTVPEIWSETDRIFCHFGPFSALLPPPTPHPPNPENQNFENKMKKCLKILSFCTCMSTINEDHMIYGSWNIKCDRQEFLSFWAIFCPFSTLTTQKIKFLTLKKTIIWCMVPDIWSMTDIIFCHSGLFFALLPTLRT